MSMLAAIKEKPFLVLLTLLALTLMAWLLGSIPALNARMLGTLILVIAFVKARVVIVHFMETHATRRSIRLAFEAWILLVGTITLGLYL